MSENITRYLMKPQLLQAAGQLLVLGNALGRVDFLVISRQLLLGAWAAPS